MGGGNDLCFKDPQEGRRSRAQSLRIGKLGRVGSQGLNGLETARKSRKTGVAAVGSGAIHEIRTLAWLSFQHRLSRCM